MVLASQYLRRVTRTEAWRFLKNVGLIQCATAERGAVGFRFAWLAALRVGAIRGDWVRYRAKSKSRAITRRGATTEFTYLRPRLGGRQSLMGCPDTGTTRTRAYAKRKVHCDLVKSPLLNERSRGAPDQLFAVEYGEPKQASAARQSSLRRVRLSRRQVPARAHNPKPGGLHRYPSYVTIASALHAP